jgi:predicted phage terminase large subunit-like protein
MPITDSFNAATGLSPEERKKLDALLTELNNRGLGGQAQKLVEQKRNRRPFHTDSSGYFVRRDGRRFIPNSDPQSAFIDDNARYVALISPRGGGKSASGAQKAMRKIARGESGAVINPVFEDFKTSTWPEFREWVPWAHVVKRHKYKADPSWEPHQPFVLAFDNGAVVYCKGLNNPESARGPNINWLWYDEARNDETGAAWGIAVASIRVGFEPQAWITTTPVGTYHWIHDFFVKEPDPELVEEFKKEAGNRELIGLYFIDKEANKPNLDPGFYISLKKAYKPGTYLYLREVEGKFADEGGALGDSAWLTSHLLEVPPETVTKRIRYYDLAASEKKISRGQKKNDPDETVSTLLSEFVAKPDDKFNSYCIEDQNGGFLKWQGIKELVKQNALQDGPLVPIWIEQEPASGGINQVEELKDFIRREVGIQWKVEGHKPEGDKIMRANPWFAEARDGRFWMVRGSWNESLCMQLNGFPEAPHDDRVDSVSGARLIIAPFKTWKKVTFLHLGQNFKENKNVTVEETEQNLAV